MGFLSRKPDPNAWIKDVGVSKSLTSQSSSVAGSVTQPCQHYPPFIKTNPRLKALWHSVHRSADLMDHALGKVGLATFIGTGIPLAGDVINLIVTYMLVLVVKDNFIQTFGREIVEAQFEPGSQEVLEWEGLVAEYNSSLAFGFYSVSKMVVGFTPVVGDALSNSIRVADKASTAVINITRKYAELRGWVSKQKFGGSDFSMSLRQPSKAKVKKDVEAGYYGSQKSYGHSYSQYDGGQYQGQASGVTTGNYSKNGGIQKPPKSKTSSKGGRTY